MQQRLDDGMAPRRPVRSTAPAPVLEGRFLVRVSLHRHRARAPRTREGRSPEQSGGSAGCWRTCRPPVDLGHRPAGRRGADHDVAPFRSSGPAAPGNAVERRDERGGGRTRGGEPRDRLRRELESTTRAPRLVAPSPARAGAPGSASSARCALPFRSTQWRRVPAPLLARRVARGCRRRNPGTARQLRKGRLPAGCGRARTAPTGRGPGPTSTTRRTRCGAVTTTKTWSCGPKRSSRAAPPSGRARAQIERLHRLLPDQARDLRLGVGPGPRPPR